MRKSELPSPAGWDGGVCTLFENEQKLEVHGLPLSASVRKEKATRHVNTKVILFWIFFQFDVSDWKVSGTQPQPRGELSLPVGRKLLLRCDDVKTTSVDEV